MQNQKNSCRTTARSKKPSPRTLRVIKKSGFEKRNSKIMCRLMNPMVEKHLSINKRQTEHTNRHQLPPIHSKPQAPRLQNSHKQPQSRIPKKTKEFSEEQTYWQQKSTEISEIFLETRKRYQRQNAKPKTHQLTC